MKKINLSVFWFLLIMLFLFTVDVSANDVNKKDEKPCYLAIGIGLEYLSYSEDEPDTGSYTDTSLYNVVAKFEGGVTLSHIFIGIKGVLPVSPGEEKEEWKRSGSIYQTNNLEYTWARIDGNVGYRFYSWLNPYLGFRWAKSKHKRNNFFRSEPVNMEAIETTRALFVSTGLKGVLKSTPEWQFRYSVEYFLPISAHTENSALSDWKSEAEDGYTIVAGAVAEYTYSPSVTFYFELSGERACWDGSGWIDYSGGSAKWPENETIALNGIIGISWHF